MVCKKNGSENYIVETRQNLRGSFHNGIILIYISKELKKKIRIKYV